VKIDAVVGIVTVGIGEVPAVGVAETCHVLVAGATAGVAACAVPLLPGIAAADVVPLVAGLTAGDPLPTGATVVVRDVTEIGTRLVPPAPVAEEAAPAGTDGASVVTNGTISVHVRVTAGSGVVISGMISIALFTFMVKVSVVVVVPGAYTFVTLTDSGRWTSI